MAIDEETRATIVRLSRAEGWPVGTIARHLGVHHGTVTRALRAAGQERRPRPKLIDPFVPFISKQLDEAPDLPASTLWRQVGARGYRGGEDHFRHSLRALGLRPARRPEPSMRLSFLPAEQAQVDWGEFGRVRIGRAEHRLMGLLVTLSHSRQSFLSLFHDARMSSFLQGHVEAFEALGGVPRRLLYDNLKSAVVARRGKAVTFHPTLLALAAHYAFEPCAAWPRRPQEKGRVERRIGFARTGFFAGRDITAPLDELNAAARAWCFGAAAERPWPDDDSLLVRDAFARERERLIPLPADPFPSEELRAVRIDKTCHARFDMNDCSVPPDFAGARLTLAATRDTVRILDGTREVARHRRCHDRQRTVSDPEHARAIAARKRHGSMSVRDRLLRTVPRAEEMLALAGHRGRNVATCARILTGLLDTHGTDEVDRAVAVALARGSCDANTVRGIVEARRAAQGLPAVSVADGGGVRGTTPRATGLDACDSPGTAGKDGT